MPLSCTAANAVRAVAGHNPDGARLLLDICRTAPEAVKRKPGDRYGPLGLALAGQPPLARAQQRVCRLFNKQWLAEQFTVAELADALEAALAEVAERRADPRHHVREGLWWSLGGRRRSGEALIGRPQQS
jgi:hypothetical protein